MTVTRVFADAEDLAIRAAQVFEDRIAASLRERGRALVVLAGGTTPRAAYERLATSLRGGTLSIDRIDWLPGDERWVPVGDPASNEGMMRRTLLEPAGAPERTIHSWEPAVGDPAECAARFAERLAAGPLAAGPDLAILGIGADGHTASLYPGATALLPGGRQGLLTPDLRVDAVAVLVGVPPGRAVRLTLTPKWLGMARCVAFLAAGDGKREALARALRGDRATPAAWVRGTTETLFLVDRAAAGPGPDATGRDVRYA